jgi:hypothetical protein
MSSVLGALREVRRAADIPRPVDPPCGLDRDATGHDERSPLDALHIPDRDASSRASHVEDVGAEDLTLVDEDRVSIETLNRARPGPAVLGRVEMSEEEPRAVWPDESLFRRREDDRAPSEEPVKMREMYVAQSPKGIHADDDERARSRVAEHDRERAEGEALPRPETAADRRDIPRP